MKNAMLELAEEIATILDHEVVWNRDAQEIEYGDAVERITALCTAAHEAARGVERLRATVADAIDALERNSTSAPVVECLKAALAVLTPPAGKDEPVTKSPPELTASRIQPEGDPAVTLDCAGGEPSFTPPAEKDWNDRGPHKEGGAGAPRRA
jgi:hypothetical protein